MVRTKKKSEQDCTDLNLNWFGNSKLEIRCVLDQENANSRKYTYPVGLTRFSILHLVDRWIHQYTQFKITKVKSSEEIFTPSKLQRVIKKITSITLTRFWKPESDKAKPNTRYIGKDTSRRSTAGKLTSLNYYENRHQFRWAQYRTRFQLSYSNYSLTSHGGRWNVFGKDVSRKRLCFQHKSFS